MEWIYNCSAQHLAQADAAAAMQRRQQAMAPPPAAVANDNDLFADMPGLFCSQRPDCAVCVVRNPGCFE